MPENKYLKIASKPLKKAMVVSHERSGTHFLMNTLDKNFSYVSQPWINFDFELGINFHSSKAILNFFRKLHNKPVLNIVKSHHHFSFFSSIIQYLTKQFHIFYIYRDPRDTMASFYRLIDHFQWDEGPRTSGISEFIRAQPRGGILRYQKEQEQDMLSRWQNHVLSWYDYAQEKGTITLIKYKDLNLNFDKTVDRIGHVLGENVEEPIRPGIDENVIHKGKGKVGGHKNIFNEDDYQFVRQKVGNTMEKLNIKW